jgi:hypothetical protein
LAMVAACRLSSSGSVDCTSCGAGTPRARHRRPSDGIARSPDSQGVPTRAGSTPVVFTGSRRPVRGAIAADDGRPRESFWFGRLDAPMSISWSAPSSGVLSLSQSSCAHYRSRNDGAHLTPCY